MLGKIRFAPSPTGYLHEGHLLSALYVWAAAKKWDLHVHLRIEDHDQGRARQAYIDGIREDLEWLGFEHQSESIQSSRFNLYDLVLEELIRSGHVYPCTCSRKQLEAENPRSETGEIIYQGKCRFNEFDRIAHIPHNLRFKIPNKVIEWHDYRLGLFKENPARQCGDFPIQDRDGFWTYQFAVCIDDLEQGITHIVRGEDIRNSTARQIILSETISSVCATSSTVKMPVYHRPFYLHHGLIVDASGKKLSKRELAHSIRQDKEAGITPEELIGRVLHKAGLQDCARPTPLDEALEQIAISL